MSLSCCCLRRRRRRRCCSTTVVIGDDDAAVTSAGRRTELARTCHGTQHIPTLDASLHDQTRPVHSHGVHTRRIRKAAPGLPRRRCSIQDPRRQTDNIAEARPFWLVRTGATRHHTRAGGPSPNVRGGIPSRLLRTSSSVRGDSFALIGWSFPRVFAEFKRARAARMIIDI